MYCDLSKKNRQLKPKTILKFKKFNRKLRALKAVPEREKVWETGNFHQWDIKCFLT